MCDRNKVVFRCLNCGRDTGCANKLICDICKDSKVAEKRRSFFRRYVVRPWFLSQMKPVAK